MIILIYIEVVCSGVTSCPQHPTPVYAQLDGVVPRVQQVQINDFTKLFSQHSIIPDKLAWSVCNSALLNQAWGRREVEKNKGHLPARVMSYDFAATICVGSTLATS